MQIQLIVFCLLERGKRKRGKNRNAAFLRGSGYGLSVSLTNLMVNPRIARIGYVLHVNLSYTYFFFSSSRFCFLVQRSDKIQRQWSLIYCYLSLSHCAAFEVSYGKLATSLFNSQLFKSYNIKWWIFDLFTSP